MYCSIGIVWQKERAKGHRVIQHPNLLFYFLYFKSWSLNSRSGAKASQSLSLSFSLSLDGRGSIDDLGGRFCSVPIVVASLQLTHSRG